MLIAGRGVRGRRATVLSAAGYETFWDSVYEHVARMAEDPAVRREFNRAAIRVFEAIIEKLRAETEDGAEPQRAR